MLKAQCCLLCQSKALKRHHLQAVEFICFLWQAKGDKSWKCLLSPKTQTSVSSARDLFFVWALYCD